LHRTGKKQEHLPKNQGIFKESQKRTNLAPLILASLSKTIKNLG
jgi:hypothetical protein